MRDASFANLGILSRHVLSRSQSSDRSRRYQPASRRRRAADLSTKYSIVDYFRSLLTIVVTEANDVFYGVVEEDDDDVDKAITVESLG